VLIDRAFAGDTRPVITSDHFESARILTRRMIAAGAADIGFLCGNPANPSIGLRIAGFRAVAGEHGGTRFAVITADEDSEETGHRLVRQLLDERQALPQGLLVSSLLVFSGAMRAIRESRGAIPPGLVLGTFDYSELFEYMPNAIYAIRQDEEELAARSFACLAGLLRKEKVAEPRQIVETKLMRFGAASRG
jgi:LacI family fructose operon transcriptional repressor